MDVRSGCPHCDFFQVTRAVTFIQNLKHKTLTTFNNAPWKFPPAICFPVPWPNLRRLLAARLSRHRDASSSLMTTTCYGQRREKPKTAYSENNAYVLQDIALTSTRKRTSKKNQPELTQSRPRTWTKPLKRSVSKGALIPLFRTNFETEKRAWLHLVSCSDKCILHSNDLHKAKATLTLHKPSRSFIIHTFNLWNTYSNRTR